MFKKKKYRDFNEDKGRPVTRKAPSIHLEDFGLSVDLEYDIIVGIHSIAHALDNPDRSHILVLATSDGLKELEKERKKHLEVENIKKVEVSKFQDIAKCIYQQKGFNFQRVSSGVLLVSTPLKVLELKNLLGIFDERPKDEKEGGLKILALDSVTDIQNAAAIWRTAAFFGVDYLIVAQKGNFSLTPGLFKMASGATEVVPLVRCHALSRSISILKKYNIFVMGLTEEGGLENEGDCQKEIMQSSMLVLGAEHQGLSNAVLRVVDKKVRLAAHKDFTTLNVSCAAAVAMEKFF